MSTRRPLLALVFVPAVACIGTPDSGTAVGNPTGLTVDTAPGQAIKFLTGEAEVDTLSTADCDGAPVDTVDVGAGVDLLGADMWNLDLSTVCSVHLAFAGPLQLTGSGPGSSSFALTLSLPELDVATAPAAIEPARAILEIASKGWISATLLGLGNSGSVTVGPGDDLHDQLIGEIRSGSAVYPDTDGDGSCDGECDEGDE
jgi:hypothetical protein